MQSTHLTRNDLIRFQCYLAKKLADSIKISQKYQNVKKVYMLIINAGNAKSYLPKYFQENYTMKGEYDKRELINNMMQLTIIQTKYIDEFIKDEKIQGVIKMHKEYMDSLKSERAYNIEREKMMIASEMSDAFDEGIEKGIIQTLFIYVQSRFEIDIKEELQSLSLDQLDQLSYKIYTLETIEEIRELLETVKTSTF